MGIGPKAYKLVLDVRDFTDGVPVTRRELSLMRRVMEETRDPVKSLGDEIDALNQLLNKGMPVEDYRRALTALKSELPENASAQALLNEQLRQAETVHQSLLTAKQREQQQDQSLNAAMEANNSLAAQGIITQEARLANFVKLNSALSYNTAIQREQIAAERENIAAQRDADDILRSLMTDEQKFAEKRARAFELMKSGNLTRQEYNQYLDKERDKTVVVAQVVDEAADARKRDGEAVQRGIALNDRWLPASMQARKELAEVTAAHKAGHVGVAAYQNAWIQLTATQLSGLPVVGRLAGAFAAIPPHLIGVAAAFGVAKVAVNVTAAAFDFSSRKIKEQYQELDRLSNSAAKLSLPVDQFLVMSHAADRADIDVAKFSKGYETMLDNVSKGAAGKKKQVEAFDLIGLDARKLKDQKPDEILRTVTDSLDKVVDASDRVRAAKGIFGDSDFLRLNLADLNRAQELMKGVGLEITALDRDRLGGLSASAKDLNFTWDAMWKKVAIDLSPALKDAADAGTELLIGVAKSEEFTDVLRESVDLTHTLASVAREIPGSIAMWGSAIESSGMSKFLRPLAAVATLGLSENVINASDDIGAARRRERDLDRQLRDKGLSGDRRTAAAISRDSDIPADEHRGNRLRDIISALEEEHAKLAMSAQAYRSRQVLLAGGGPIEMNVANAIAFMNEELKKNSEIANKAVEAEKRRQEAVRGIITGLNEEQLKLRMSAAAYHDYQVAKAGGGILDRFVAAAKFDETEKVKKEANAAKMAKEAIKELEKEKRQFGMTDIEKKMDDFRTEGVPPEEREKIELLLKEKELREAILKSQQASAFTLARGSREEAESMVKAQRAAELRMQELIHPATRRFSAPIPIDPFDNLSTLAPELMSVRPPPQSMPSLTSLSDRDIRNVLEKIEQHTLKASESKLEVVLDIEEVRL